MNTPIKPSPEAMRVAEAHYRLPDAGKFPLLREQCNQAVEKLATQIDSGFAAIRNERDCFRGLAEADGSFSELEAWAGKFGIKLEQGSYRNMRRSAFQNALAKFRKST